MTGINIREYICCYFIPMGNCAGKTGPSKARKPQITTHESKQVHPKEFRLLQTIYIDLATRIQNKQLNKQNFLLFFHKNGLWGDRLFKEFDADDSNLISQSQFIRGIEKIFKTTEEYKIKLLFKFLAGSSKQAQGIPFSEFLKMLYNYPKEDLQKILNDSDFVDKEIKSHLVAVDTEFQGRRFESVCPKDVKDMRIAKAKYQFKDSDKNSDRLQSRMGQDILREISKKKQVKNTTLKIKVGEYDVEIKTTSIHQFVKKFAKSIFKSYHINEKNGYLEYQHFKDWILSHKNLYDDYYSGFHSQIWEIDKATELPEFVKREFQMTSRSRYVIGKKAPVKVKISLLHSILIVTLEQQDGWPLQVICLDGLSTEKIFDSQNGYGIVIKHREKSYPEKKFYFLNESIQSKWIEQLKFFKGSSINALYEIGQEIGKGKFSLVYEGTEKQTGEKCALKIIDKKVLDKESLELIAHESSIMSVLSHPLMVFFKQTIQTNSNIYIVTELVKGKDLFEFVKDVKFLQEEEAAFIFKQIIVGLRYLHSLGIVHRDLKPENVMVECDENGQISKIKIIDFGFANYLTVLLELDQTELMAGTPNYIAPQILNQTSFSQKIDNFAVGSMLYFTLSGTQPFNGETITQILTLTMSGTYSINDKHWKKISMQAKDLINRFLDDDPTTRISLDEALNHSWFQKMGRSQKDLRNGDG